MSNHIYEVELSGEPPFADGNSVLYAEKPEYWHTSGIVITGDMTPDQVAREIAKAFPNHFTLLDIAIALGKTPVVDDLVRETIMNY